MKKKILIVGGAGFLGFNLILKLKSLKQYHITVASRSFSKKLKKINYIKINLSNLNELKKKLSGKSFNIVINFSGNINHKNKKETFKSHYIICKNLVDFFEKKSIDLFIQAGSSLEYGNLKSPNVESMKCKPNSYYGSSKLKATNYLKNSKINYLILRLYQIYGPHQKINRLIPLCINSLLKNKLFKTTSGNQIRDFLYVDDFTNLIIKIIKKRRLKKGIYNVGSGLQISVKKVLDNLQKKIKNGKIIFSAIPMRKDENNILYPNIAKIKKDFKWKPRINLQIGLNKTIKFYKHINEIS